MDQINSPSLQGEVRLQDVPSLPHSLAELRTMDYKDFELLSAAALVACEEQQFVMHTGKRGDRGVDVLLRNAVGNRVILQCKRSAASNPVGPSKIRELGGTLKTHRAAYGYLLTSSTFTRAAYQEKESHGFIRTFDGSELMGLLQRHPHAIAQALAAIRERIEEAAQR